MALVAVARPDANFSTPVNTALVVGSGSNLMLNDFSPNGATLTASVVTNPTNGTLSNFSGSGGTFTYTPTTGFSGIDSWSYKTNNGTADSNTTTVSIAVGGNFGPRTNLEETSRDGMLMVGGNEVRQPLTPAAGRQATGSELDWPGLSLVYRSDVAVPKPIIVVDTFLQSNSAVPTEIQAQLTFNGTAGTSYSYNTSGLTAGQNLRFALQADATALATGRYAYTFLSASRGNNFFDFRSAWLTPEL